MARIIPSVASMCRTYPNYLWDPLGGSSVSVIWWDQSDCMSYNSFFIADSYFCVHANITELRINNLWQYRTITFGWFWRKPCFRRQKSTTSRPTFSNLQVSSSFKQDRAPVILQDLVDQVSPSGASIRFYVSFWDFFDLRFWDSMKKFPKNYSKRFKISEPKEGFWESQVTRTTWHPIPSSLSVRGCAIHLQRHLQTTGTFTSSSLTARDVERKIVKYLDQTHFEFRALNTSAALRKVCSVVFGILVAAIFDPFCKSDKDAVPGAHRSSQILPRICDLLPHAILPGHLDSPTAVWLMTSHCLLLWFPLLTGLPEHATMELWNSQWHLVARTAAVAFLWHQDAMNSVAPMRLYLFAQS